MLQDQGWWKPTLQTSGKTSFFLTETVFFTAPKVRYVKVICRTKASCFQAKLSHQSFSATKNTPHVFFDKARTGGHVNL